MHRCPCRWRSSGSDEGGRLHDSRVPHCRLRPSPAASASPSCNCRPKQARTLLDPSSAYSRPSGSTDHSDTSCVRSTQLKSPTASPPDRYSAARARAASHASSNAQPPHCVGDSNSCFEHSQAGQGDAGTCHRAVLRCASSCGGAGRDRGGLGTLARLSKGRPQPSRGAHGHPPLAPIVAYRPRTRPARCSKSQEVAK